MFFSTIPDMSFDDIWRDVFLLPWRASLPDRATDFTLNSCVRGLDIAELPSGYKPSSQNATWIDGVAPENALYMDREEVRKLEKGKAGETSGRALVKTSIAFATHKKGRVGYVGDMNIKGSKDAAQIILAMCFYPGSKAPAAPGTGGPPVSVLFRSLLLLSSNSQRLQVLLGATSTDEPLPRPRNILILSLEKDPWSDETYTQLHSALRTNANLTEVQSPAAPGRHSRPGRRDHAPRAHERPQHARRVRARGGHRRARDGLREPLPAQRRARVLWGVRPLAVMGPRVVSTTARRAASTRAGCSRRSTRARFCRIFRETISSAPGTGRKLQKSIAMRSCAAARNLFTCRTSLRRSSNPNYAFDFGPSPHPALTRSSPMAYRYELAGSATSRALLHDPKHIKALYRRALARNALGRYNAAMHGLYHPPFLPFARTNVLNPCGHRS